MPLLPASDHPPTFFQSQPSEPSSMPPRASKTSQHPILSLVPNYPSTMSSQIRQYYSSKVEAMVSCLVSTHLRASYTYFSPGFYFPCKDSALDGVGRFFHQSAEKLEGTELLLKTQTQQSSHSLFQDVQKLFQDEWVRPWTPWKPPWFWRRT